ncbi:ATP-binding protein [Nocardia iowensis]|uniref:AAA family ATPase n=1 Tax=Nocardia iowensis TaxID=204891 RepID=A0ABX8RNV4_NOCIO|nr:helix-turn-helix transcriptional regulator [Nocardia iowensis]QXN90105.1 AAA family ATPase [Nocardia iowensis]
MLVGRDRELSLIADALSPHAAGPSLIALLGEAGIGKSALLSATAEAAVARGARVLRARGSAAETDLAYAGLHQLLYPLLDHADALPTRQRAALLTAFGFGDETAAPDRMIFNMAVLTLLSNLAEQQPLLLVLDDLQWFDPVSRALLAFLIRRLEGEPIGVVAACRGERLPDEFEDALPSIVLGPLGPAESRQVLDLLPDAPDGALREQVLATAEGNPLALHELPRAMRNAEVFAPAIPVTDRLIAAFAAQLTALPADTQRALLVTATAGTTDQDVVLAVLPPARAEVWRPAEQAGLVRLSPGRIEFRHPLIRSAIYGAAPWSVRRKVHLELAEALAGDIVRQAWHLAAATIEPDEEVAQIIEQAAMRSWHRGALAEGATGLVRAAQLTPGVRDHGRRLFHAAIEFFAVGMVSQARTLVARAGELVALNDESADDAMARAWRSVDAAQSCELDRAYDLLTPALDSPELYDAGTLTVLIMAGEISYLSGRAGHRARSLRAMADIDWIPAEYRLDMLVAVDPFGFAETARKSLPDMMASEQEHTALNFHIARICMRLDETATAVRLLNSGANPERPDAHLLLGGIMTAYLGVSLFYTGRWDEAERAIAKIDIGAESLPVQFVRFTQAAVAALRGETVHASTLAAEILARIPDPASTGEVIVKAYWVAGMAATTEGDYQSGFDWLRKAFDAAGGPLHYGASCYYVADLAAAAARTGRVEQVGAILERAVSDTAAGSSPRLRAIFDRARALLATGADAEQYFRAALGDATGEQWPFERAQTQLEFGEWLRRARRIAEARPMLSDALRIFERLGAAPWAERARAELRAAGLNPKPVSQGAVADLPSRTRQIVELAAAGYTNKEIGERLYLSHRTVGSHLYQAFPLLGVTARSQLRDVVAEG